jgi:uroporphyrinogen-III decarboxylase
MTRRERLMATLRGEPVDRPAVSFYEIGGWKLNPDDPDPFNVYSGPGWRELIQLAEEETDLIRMMHPTRTPATDNCYDEFFTIETYFSSSGRSQTAPAAARSGDRPQLTGKPLPGESRFTRTTLTVAGRTMTSLTRCDPDVATVWTVKPLLKDADDARAYLHLPDAVFAYDCNLAPLVAEDTALGDTGIVMVDVADPICEVAGLFELADYTVLALTEPALFHRLLEQQARHIYPLVDQVAREFPGHLWRVVGSEYASEPLLPPRLYEEYVVRYTRPIVQTIQKYGGFARIHSHGKLKRILPAIAAMEPAGLDPVEPPPQGDMQLIDVRRAIGAQTVLFGNIEAAEIELLPPDAFETRARQALREGTDGEGRGFVLMPSSCPYGREISAQVMANYETLVRLAHNWGSQRSPRFTGTLRCEVSEYSHLV